ncbi:unnamed protein product [Amoebophrya sp. A25]|nr:unnamed protein product [Amoebophrya sp. A25]|eukprot:GSA25T00005230001.1
MIYLRSKPSLQLAMRPLALLVVLLLSLGEAAGRRQGVAVAMQRLLPDRFCSCDCCVSLGAEQQGCTLVQLAVDLGHSVPRNCPLSTGSCAATIEADDDEEQKEELDYSRFCYSNCRSTTKAQQCMPAKQAAGDRGSAVGGAAAAKTPLSLLRQRAKAKRRPRRDPPISLVKAQMMQAYSYAKSAGEAAMRARLAYERTLGQVKQQSESFGQELIREVKHQARVQATVALQKRKAFEGASLAAAHDAGAAVLAQYEADSKAMAKASADLAKRAGEYSKAAAEREATVDTWAQRAETAKGIEDHEGEQRSLLQMYQAEEQAAELSKRGAEIQKDAAQAADAAAFYSANAAGAAEHALEQALPKGVAIPLPGDPLRFN